MAGNPHFLGRVPQEGNDAEGGHATSGQTPPAPYTAGPSAGRRNQLCAQKMVPWPSRGCLGSEATGLKFWGCGFWEKAPSETGGNPPVITRPPHSPCGRTGRVLLAPCPNSFLAHANLLYHFCLRNGSGRCLSRSLK